MPHINLQIDKELNDKVENFSRSSGMKSKADAIVEIIKKFLKQNGY